MAASRRARTALVGVFLAVVAGAAAYRFGVRSDGDFALADHKVVVTARLPVDALFPIEFLITNDFQTLTDVRLACIVDRVVTDAVDLVDTDASAREVIPAFASGAQRSFTCPAPAGLSAPLPLDSVRRAHVNVDLVFSLRGRWQPLRLRQGFDLVVDPVRRPFWQADPPMLSR